jgi:hypothetical protein
MITIAFFDVGETLIHSGVPLSGVPESLAAISAFETANGEQLTIGVISDYHMPAPPVTEAKIEALEEQYRSEVLAPSGLEQFFQPFESRVTISSRAGVRKPERKIFDVAVVRTQKNATLNECLFVTENTNHLQKCQEYGMTPVRFGPAGSDMIGFEDWANAPALISRLVAPGRDANQARAAAADLAVRHGLLGFDMTGKEGSTIHGRANQLIQLNDPRLGPLNGVYIERPSEVRVEFTADGRIADVAATSPEREEVADAVNFVSSLVKTGRVAIPGQPPPAFGTTHTVETDRQGRRRLVRRGYSAR